jgi:hypothetical protein
MTHAERLKWMAQEQQGYVNCLEDTADMPTSLIAPTLALAQETRERAAALLAGAESLERETWRPMSEYDGESSVMRPHIYYGPMPVKPWNIQYPGCEVYPWACVSTSQMWPEDAFLPYFMQIPKMLPQFEAEIQARMAPPLPEIDDLPAPPKGDA